MPRLDQHCLASLLAALLAVWAIPGVGSAADQGAQSVARSGPPSVEMRGIDELFTQNYARALARAVDRVKQTGLIVVQGGDLFLYLDGKLVDQATTGSPPAYQNLKIVDHLPLAVYVLLIDQVGQRALTPEAQEHVQRYLEALRALGRSIDASRFPGPGSLPRQREILEESAAFLEKVSLRGRVSEASLLAFARSQGKALNANLGRAAGAQLEALNRIVVRWREQYIDWVRWPSIRVVVMGPATAHHQELHLQYFSEVMGVPMEGTDRLIFYEGEDRAGAEALVGRYALDGRASEAFFDRRNRLFSDLMAGAARAWLVDHASELVPAVQE